MNSTAKGADSVRRSRAIEEDDFFALRRWRSGDSRKNIHWRSTAKQRFPIVKQFVERNNRDFALALDLFVDDDQPQTQQNCETVLSFAATTLLNVKAVVEGQAAIAVCGKNREAFRSKTVGGLVADAMPALAVADGQERPAIIEGVVSCLESVSPGTPIYVISSREMPTSLQQGLEIEAMLSEAEFNADDEFGQGVEAQRKRQQRSRYVARRMRMGLPMVRWMNVQTNEFKEIFSVVKKSQQRRLRPAIGESQPTAGAEQANVKPIDRPTMPSDLADVSQNWIDHAKS